VNRARSELSRQISQVRDSLRSLDRSLRRLVPFLEAAATPSLRGSSTRPPRRLSAKARASLVLQGRYMGFMRQLKPRHKAQVRKVREAKGVREAIVKAKGLVASTGSRTQSR